MGTREDVLNSIRHKQPDKIPYDIRFTIDARKKMVAYYDDPEFELKLNNCLTIVRTNTHREVSPNIWQDQFGVKWDRTLDKDIGVVKDILITPQNLADFVLPDPDDPKIYRRIRQALPKKKNTLLTVKMSYNLFERAWSLAGMQNVFLYMLDNKDFLNKLLDKILEYNLRLIENTCKIDIDAILFGDDWGQQTGLLMGPQLWGEFIEPRIGEMYKSVKGHGKYVFLHCCGKIQEILPELIGCGLDVFNPFQPEVMDVYEMKRLFGDQLTFYGGISTQKTLPFANPQDVGDEVKKLIEVVGKNGGLIVSPAHAVPGDAKPENIARMIEVLESQ
jgi:uroporphyrinogen decarboxylase